MISPFLGIKLVPAGLEPEGEGRLEGGMISGAEVLQAQDVLS